MSVEISLIYILSDSTVVLTNQTLREKITRSISWGLRRLVRKTDNLPPSCAVVTKSGDLNYLEHSRSVTE